jgi:hypothetical protein
MTGRQLIPNIIESADPTSNVTTVCPKIVPAKARLPVTAVPGYLMNTTCFTHIMKVNYIVIMLDTILLEVHLINCDGRCPLSEIDVAYTKFLDLAIPVFR